MGRHRASVDLQRGSNEHAGRAGERLVQQFITEYFLNNETNVAQANFFARAELYRANYRLAKRFVAELRRATPGDSRRAPAVARRVSAALASRPRPAHDRSVVAPDPLPQRP